jgi:two-component system chemotaxis response regulator CheB
MAMPALPLSTTPDPAGPYRVLVVDDSAVIRTILAAWLRVDKAIAVAGFATDGDMAVETARKLQPEVVLLDIEMPGMNGLDALPGILKAAPGARVIMCSTLTHAGAEITMRALHAGAADYVAKPQSAELGSADHFRRDLIEKVKALAESARREAKRPLPFPAEAERKASAAGHTLRRPGTAAVRLLLIGCSTGGPQALIRLFSEWRKPPRVPILITQHMPPTFTALLARRLDAEGTIPCREAVEGAPLQPGLAYLATGDRHLTVAAGPAGPCVKLDDGPQENFCRPAVDPMFRSAAALYGAGCLAAVLTGMGHDGLAGARTIVDAGGTVLTQDRATSIVWGMPGAVTEAGLSSRVLPLAEMTHALQQSINGDLT